MKRLFLTMDERTLASALQDMRNIINIIDQVDPLLTFPEVRQLLDLLEQARTGRCLFAGDLLANCPTVPCPCLGGCPGTLMADGRNVSDDLTFLECDVCGCVHVARDVEVPAPNIRESP